MRILLSLLVILSNLKVLTEHVLDSTFAAMVLGAVYGIEIREPDDKHYHMIERMGDIAEQVVIPGRFPVEAFPILRYLPSWFPGGAFKKWAADAKRDMLNTVDALFESSKSVMVRISLLERRASGPERTSTIRQQTRRKSQ